MKELLADATWYEMRARSVANYGVPYAGLKSYATNVAEFVSPPMTDRLKAIGRQIQIQFGFEPNNCLINYYRDGDSTIGFHSDSIKEIVEGTGIAILSLGGERELSFKHKLDKTVRTSKLLQNGSLFYMTREMQSDWKHGILPTTVNALPRMSLTFRQLA